MYYVCCQNEAGTLFININCINNDIILLIPDQNLESNQQSQKKKKKKKKSYISNNILNLGPYTFILF